MHNLWIKGDLLNILQLNQELNDYLNETIVRKCKMLVY